MIFDLGILPDPKQHIIHALYVGFDESENEDERLAIERGLRAIVTFQERIGEEPLKQIFNETQKIVEQISPNLNDINQDFNNEDDQLFKKMADVRDQELELHFNHLKIENIKE